MATGMAPTACASGIITVTVAPRTRLHYTAIIEIQRMPDLAYLYSPPNRARMLIAAVALIAVIAAVDWAIKPNFSLNFLYLFPIMLAGGFLSRLQIVGLGIFC